MSQPREPVPIPAVVATIAAGRPVAAVWVNELGGVTFRIDDGAEYVKVATPEWAHLLVAESERLRWAASYARVPRVLGAGDGWLHTAGLHGRSAVDPRWVADPRTAASAIGAGLRLLHDALSVADCPFGPPQWVTTSLSIDRLVVCHGDACAPNTLIDADGRCCGHVDMGDLGVADRWADLAVAAWSLGYNYGRGWRADFFNAYGVEDDPDRIDYYLRLWEDGDDSAADLP